ncbi:MAG: MerC domain-containing protein [Bacteroidota bacterium]
MRRYFHDYADYLGLTSAIVCLIHCLVAPLFLGVVTHVHAGEAHVHEVPWYALPFWDYVFLGFGFLAVRWSVAHSHHTWIKRLLWISLAGLAGAIFLEEVHHIFSYLVYASSAALIIFHVWNIRSHLGKKIDQTADGATDSEEKDSILISSREKIAV